MSVRRIVSVLSVVLVASATAVVAQPKKGAPAPAKEAPAPAKDPAPTGLEKAPADAGSGSATEDAGSAVQMAEDPPPSDMEGTNENPDAPKSLGGEPTVPSAPPVLKKSGYPIEEVFRPITLPQNMSEVSLDIHAALSPYTGSSTLRARYGITRQVQLGLSYLIGGIYADEDFVPGASGSTKFHAGKAVGVDVTVLVANWIGIKVGVPVYIDPLAFGLNIGVPVKFVFGDKLALGGLDDLLSIKLTKFAPTFYQESTNATAAAGTDDTGGSNTVQSRGALRFSGYAIYQHKPELALVGRLGVTMEDFAATGTQSNAENGGLTTFLRAGVQYSAKKFLDIGGSLGFDDLAELGSFGPAVYLNVRI